MSQTFIWCPGHFFLSSCQLDSSFSPLSVPLSCCLLSLAFSSVDTFFSCLSVLFVHVHAALSFLLFSFLSCLLSGLFFFFSLPPSSPSACRLAVGLLCCWFGPYQPHQQVEGCLVLQNSMAFWEWDKAPPPPLKPPKKSFSACCLVCEGSVCVQFTLPRTPS